VVLVGVAEAEQHHQLAMHRGRRLGFVHLEAHARSAGAHLEVPDQRGGKARGEVAVADLRARRSEVLRECETVAVEIRSVRWGVADTALPTDEESTDGGTEAQRWRGLDVVVLGVGVGAE
jgi:hypothetical protein